MQRSLMAMLGAGLPLWYARAVLAEKADEAAVREKKVGPNDTIQVGVIGTGDRFKGGLFHDVKRHKAFRIVACCDVDKKHLEGVAKMAEKEYKNEVARYGDFRELCARKDIDAVVIATPDHWHTLTAIAALRGGKDVYCEKPLTLTINEGKALASSRSAASSARTCTSGWPAKSFATAAWARSCPSRRALVKIHKAGRSRWRARRPSWIMISGWARRPRRITSRSASTMSSAGGKHTRAAR
ncbi:MAG: Gfo/Idh/MocA family oxidoreductase [Planctomycetota bacterium]|nr:MAG: Gfo/Idh/MocA family oxidoreductase [Planctomycetota bacterium]